MFKKVKKILGIEGVKMTLNTPDIIFTKEGKFHGKLTFTSLSDQLVTKVRVSLIEKYSRGRKSAKLVDEYKLGSIELTDPISIGKHQTIDVEFELPFVVAKSEMDMLQDSNFLMKGIVRLAKYARNVKSEYRIDAEAKVKGTKLNPSVSAPVQLK